MEKLTTGNITLLSDIKDYDLNFLQGQVDTAIEFLCSNIGVQPSDFNFNLIVTENFQNQISDYVEGYTVSINVNAFAINRFQITNTVQEKKDVIIMKWDASNVLDDVIFNSILVHELVHHLDYKQIDSINAEFSVNIYSSGEVKNELEKALKFLLQARSEMRAFYYDEKYLLVNNYYSDPIDQFKTISDDEYSLGWVLPRLMGKVKCWEEMNVRHDKVIEAKSYITTTSIYGSNWGNIIRNCFEYRDFHAKCVQFQLGA